MATNELQFPVRLRGELRDQWLENYRFGLRQMRDPRTGNAFTEDQIAIATAPHSELWIKADGIDAVLALNQQRALWLAQQGRPDFAAGVTLRNQWAENWGLPFLAASGGSGQVLAPCEPQTTFPGSTTIGDPAAIQCRDPAGLRYQVLFTLTSAVNGAPAELSILAIDTGDSTNLEAGTALTWINPPLGVTSAGPTVIDRFTGGLEDETDAEYQPRLIRRIRHKPGAGNRAQVIEWTFDAAQNAIGGAWVYGAAFRAGSALVAIAQKRGSTRGPLGRVPSIGTMVRVTEYLATVIPVTPGPPAVLALPVVPVPSNFTISLALAKNSANGWADPTPWPVHSGPLAATITVVGAQTLIRIKAFVDPPAGPDLPQVAVWDDATSSFELLAVSVISPAGGGDYIVLLANAPQKTLVVGDVLSPWTEQAELISGLLTAYADSLGAGEVVDVSSSSQDDRRGFAFRFPKPNEEAPARAGTGVISFLQDGLGASLADTSVDAVSVATPPVPIDPSAGPGIIVLGKVGIYAL